METALSESSYDAIIIGAGLGGLVCGCYLAKSGMKVLICEQHSKPGGYCASFDRRGHRFDAAAHAVGGLRQGHFGEIVRSLGIDKRVAFRKIDPSDIVISPEGSAAFHASEENTLSSWQALAPDELPGLERLFRFLRNPEPQALTALRNATFDTLLRRYLRNDRLMSTLSFPLFGNSGLPPSRLSAFLGVKIFQEFLFDGGYYPEGGMQSLSEAFAAAFRSFGGEIWLSAPVRKITLDGNRVNGVSIKGVGFTSASSVVSNCDALQTFTKLLGRRGLPAEHIDMLSSMEPSLSGFMVYLGFRRPLAGVASPGSNYWKMLTYDLDSAFRAAQCADVRRVGGYIAHPSPDRTSLFVFMNAGFRSCRYWKLHKQAVRDALVERIDRDLFPGTSDAIDCIEAATPHTLHRYTLNHRGAAFGWAGTPSQFALPGIRRPAFARGLHLCGHWTTHGMGIPGAAYTGFDTAKIILRERGIA